MIDIEDVLERGGQARIALLHYCVLSVSMTPIFIFLAQAYRGRASVAGALALYDMFCAPQAPARLADYELLPPRELTLAHAAAHLREQWQRMQTPAQPEEEETACRPWPLPARDLFDALVRGLRSDADGRLARIAESFDPQLTAFENLPGRTMTAGQRQFVDRVWQPIVKPRLRASGFWQMSTIG